jgi:WD40 repeat protein
VTAGNDPFAMVWDAATGKLQHRLTHGLGKWVRGLALSADGQAIATSSLDDTVRIWDRRTGELKYTLFGHGALGGTRAVRFTPDGSRLLSWGDDLFLRIFDARTGKALQEHSLRPAGMTVQLDEDGSVDQGPAAPFHHFEGAAFTRDGTRLILSTGTVFVFDVETGRQLQQFPERNLFGGLALAPDDTRLALVERGPDRETPLPGGRIQFETSRTQILKLLSLSTGEVLQEWPLPDGFTARIAYSGDGRRVAVAIHDTTWSAHVYDAESGNEVASIETHDQEIRGLAVSPDGGGLATALGDATVVIWDITHFESAGR